LGNVEGAVTTGELAGPAAETWAVAVADDAGGATACAAAEDECAGGATAGAAAEDEGAGAVTAGAAAEDEGAEGVTVGRSRGRWIHGHRRRHRWSRGSGTGHALVGGSCEAARAGPEVGRAVPKLGGGARDAGEWSLVAPVVLVGGRKSCTRSSLVRKSSA
jgi:hypothetical protein